MKEGFCQRCKKRIPNRREFWDNMRNVRKLPRGPARYRTWWAFKDSVCTCPERGNPIAMVERCINFI